jgi:hypothetical protein
VLISDKEPSTYKEMVVTDDHIASLEYRLKKLKSRGVV